MAEVFQKEKGYSLKDAAKMVLVNKDEKAKLDYFEMIKVTVKCAAKLDMAAWLYDEGGWPSGTLNGYFRDHRPDLMAQSISADGTITYGSFTPDLLNPEVTRIFIEATHEKYKACVGESFGTTIPGIFTDEPSFGLFSDKSLPYSPFMAEVFQKEKGYSLKDAAKMVLVNKDEKARLDYFDIRTKLIRESFLLPIQKWCHENNLISTGHFNGDDIVKNAVNLLGGDLAAPSAGERQSAALAAEIEIARRKGEHRRKRRRRKRPVKRRLFRRFVESTARKSETKKKILRQIRHNRRRRSRRS
jgi:hypothetical protein